MTKPFVAILMGSDSNLETMQPCIETLDKFGIAREVNVLCAHRTRLAGQILALADPAIAQRLTDDPQQPCRVDTRQERAVQQIDVHG